MKKPPFDPVQPVNIHNNWPDKDYPIKKGSMVWFFTQHGEVLFGKVTWYHPARKRDASCVISAGQPFYKIKVAGRLHDEHVNARLVRPKTKVGFEALRKIILADIRGERAMAAERFKKQDSRYAEAVNYWTETKAP